jgi:nonsense-mediated mRNA decay protein 3
VSDQQYHTKTHLGHLLNVGDVALGFDLANSNLNDPNIELYNAEDLPDIILVRKIYDDKLKRHKQRKWKLERLAVEMDESEVDNDYLEFLEDIEEDPKLRKNIIIYQDVEKIHVEIESGESTAPRVSFSEMVEVVKTKPERELMESES